MRLVRLSDEAHNTLTQAELELPTKERFEIAREKSSRIKAGLSTPISLMGATKVTYDHKTNSYTVAFSDGEGRSTTLKATNDVATFVTANIRVFGSWQGNIENGTLVDVDLVQD